MKNFFFCMKYFICLWFSVFVFKKELHAKGQPKANMKHGTNENEDDLFSFSHAIGFYENLIFGWIFIK